MSTLDKWEEPVIQNKFITFIEKIITAILVFLVLVIVFVFESGYMLISFISVSMIAFFSLVILAITLGYLFIF